MTHGMMIRMYQPWAIQPARAATSAALAICSSVFYFFECHHECCASELEGVKPFSNCSTGVTRNDSE